MRLPEQGLPAIVWIFDSGAEGVFPISLFSLRRAAPSLFERGPLIVIDCGMTEVMRTWLRSKRLSNLSVVTANLPEPSRVMGGASWRAASIMRLRIELPRLLEALIAQSRVPRFATFLQLDTDTAFLSDPLDEMSEPWEGEDIRCCYEWDWVGQPQDDHQEFMKFVRASSFAATDYPDKLPQLADALHMSIGELKCVPTVNSGVWMARVGSALSDKWVESYSRLVRLDAELGPGFFNPYSAEQNALSLAIYRGAIAPRFMPRRMNHLPPRDPHLWPEDLCVAHFISFARNWPRRAYRLWSTLRELTIQSRFAPSSLLMPQLADPPESA